MRRNYRKRQQVKQTIQATAIFGTIIATVALSMWAFPRIDCNTARNGLAFIEACEADENCTLRAHELNLKESYTRLEIKSCPKD